MVLDWATAGPANFVSFGAEHLWEVSLAEMDQHWHAVLFQGHVPALCDDPLPAGSLGVREAFPVVLAVLQPFVMSGPINLSPTGRLADHPTDLECPQELDLVFGQRAVFAWVFLLWHVTGS